MAQNDIVLVRHGQTQWSISGRHTGRTDIPLTDLGRQQADALGEMLDGRDFSLVLSSPLKRAWETMQRAGYAAQGMPDENILEWDYGVFEGRTTADIRSSEPDWSVWTSPSTAAKPSSRSAREPTWPSNGASPPPGRSPYSPTGISCGS